MERRDLTSCVSSRRQDGAVEVGERLASGDGDDDDGDEEEGVETGGDEHVEVILEIEDYGQGTVEDSEAGLACVSSGLEMEVEGNIQQRASR